MMADKDKEARAAVRESDEETSSPPQSEMVQTPCLSDIWKATGLGSRMNNLQDQMTRYLNVPFLPFVMLQKITKDKACGVVVVPYWPNQLWFPRLASMVTS